eukprot:3287686-Prymnesium_polylepis.1
MVLLISESDSPATKVCCSLAVESVPSTKTVAVMPFTVPPGLDELAALGALADGGVPPPGGENGMTRGAAPKMRLVMCGDTT